MSRADLQKLIQPSSPANLTTIMIFCLIRQLQIMMNPFAGVLTRTRKYERITAVTSDSSMHKICMVNKDFYQNELAESKTDLIKHNQDTKYTKCDQYHGPLTRLWHCPRLSDTLVQSERIIKYMLLQAHWIKHVYKQCIINISNSRTLKQVHCTKRFCISNIVYQTVSSLHRMESWSYPAALFKPIFSLLYYYIIT